MSIPAVDLLPRASARLPREDNEPARPRLMTAIELFAGAGGLAIGSHEAGFRHLAVIEIDSAAAKTARENSKRVLGIDPSLILTEDAQKVELSHWLGQVDLLSGGPPCQPFSQGGRSRGHADERNMFPAFLRAMAHLRPRAILVENVAGLLRPRFSEYWEYLRLRLRYPILAMNEGEDWPAHLARLRRVRDHDVTPDERYEIKAQLVDAADFGIPQRRQRVMIVGYRADLGIEPHELLATHSAEALLREQWVTGEYWKRHGIAPHECHLNAKLLRTLEAAHGELLPSATALPWRTVRDALADLPSPVTRGQTPTMSNHVQHPGARAYRGHSGSHYDLPAKALKAGAHGTPGGENTVIDPVTNELRYFTTREAARLQTFPDSWEFHGSWGAAIKQLGNAVPVDIARRFTQEVFLRLSTADQRASARETIG